jgi:hypothetical protein
MRQCSTKADVRILATNFAAAVTAAQMDNKNKLLASFMILRF